MKIEVFIEVRDVFAIAIEHQRFLFAGKNTAADTPFSRLAPSWVIHGRIHVGVKTVLPSSGHVPAGLRPRRHEFDLHDTLNALKAVFPGHDQTNRRAVLIRDRLTVNAHCQNRQGISGFGDRQAFTVGLVQGAAPQAGHLFAVIQGFEGDILGFGRWLKMFDHISQ